RLPLHRQEARRHPAADPAGRAQPAKVDRDLPEIGARAMSTASAPVVSSDPSNETGYHTFRLGKFELARDEYFVTVRWPAKGQMRSHQMSAEAFLRACMRDVAWNFFY